MNDAIERLVGQQVQVWSNSAGQGFTDAGILVSFDYPWLVIRADSGELFCFPVHNVRLMKGRAPRGDTHLASTD
jgi:hypothetical protein